MNAANQALGIEIVEVGRPHHPTRSHFCRRKQEDPRFSAATEAPTTELLDYFLPQVEIDLDARSAGPQSPAPIRESSKCPRNRHCSAFRAGPEEPTAGPLTSPKLAADA